MSEIEQLVRREIRAHGPISFARFMELALYCPKIGYYERDNRVIGFGGDFYTSASVGLLFGQLLAAQFAFWSVGFAGQTLTWVEAGAHDGTLAVAILEWLGKNQPDLLERLTYSIIEPSPVRRQWQAEKLSAYAKHVAWRDSIADFGPSSIRGIIFSNEFLDAFPVQRIVWDSSASTWYERGVGLKGEHLVWQPLERPSIDIETQLEQGGFALSRGLLEALPDGFIIDLAPAAGDWWKQAAQALDSGKLMAIDYGYTVDEILAPERADGTLRAYYRQRISDDILAHAGEQDITAHVNFTQFQRIGEAEELKTEAFLTQERFLFGIVRQSVGSPEGASAPLSSPSPGGEGGFSASGVSERWSQSEVRQFQTLTHPEQLGRRFRVLVQNKSRTAGVAGG